MDKLRDLIKVENEDNAIVCIKVVMDLQRHHVSALKDRVQPFLELIKEIFGNTERIARENFSVQPPQGQLNPQTAAANSQSPRPASPAVPPADAGAVENRPLLKATQSFKVVAETPIAVVSIFQQYRDVPQTWTRQFAPLMKTVLYSQAPAQENAHAEAKAQNTFHFGVAKGIKNRAAFGDLVTAQVKMMSFVAFILRVFGQSLQEFLPKLPEIVVRLLRDCPREKCQVRKELIVAIRHIINFNFRKVFLPVIDDLLDERTLLGDGLTVHDALRPLSYSTLADLIHHVRDSLSMDQIRTTVRVYRQNMLGHLAGTSFQTMSASLLLNMAECIAKLENKKEARYFLMTILEATGDKCAAMNRQYHNAVKISSQHDHQNTEVTSADFMASKDHPPAWDDVDIFSTQTIKTNNLRDRAADPVTDNKFLFKKLVNGLKGVFYQLRVCNPPNMIDPANEPVNWNEIACGFSAEEVQVLIKLFHEGTKMFQYYQSEKPASETNMSPAEILGSHHPVCGKDEKDLLDSFATVFHHVDPATFHEIFHSEIPHIYEMMFEHPALLQIPQFLLASEATSPHFAGMLLQFLMSKIEDVGSSDINKATILLRLFKLSFMAVTLFSAQNEAVLLPHVNKLVTSSIRLSTTAEAPLQYFYLLRSLFRSIGGGRFEHLYHEILPLLEMLLEVLNDLISAARSTAEQDLYVELSLTVPARLSNLLPHLSYLMKPLVLALRAGSELVSQGLRTLELCVDNLTADYLDPIMAPVIDDLMTALWDHLKPSPYNHFHAHTTMRILGKLGGRNRKFLEVPPGLGYKLFAESGSTVDLQLIGASSESRFPVELGIDVAISKLREASPKPTEVQATQTMKHQKQQAFQFVVTQVKLLLGPDELPPDFLRLVRLHANKVSDGNLENVNTRHSSNSREQSIAKKDESQETLKKLLKACIYATSNTDLSGAAHAFLSNIYKHFAILEIGQALIDIKTESGRNIFQVDTSEGPVEIDHRVLVMVIVESLSSEEIAARETAQNAIVALHDAASVLFGSEVPVMKLPMFTQLLNTSCHSCYKPEWFSKAGGALGINTMATQLGLDGTWFVEKQLDICRALMYAAKDLPEDLPQSTRVQALDTLKIILRKCNGDITVDEAVKPGSKIHSLCSFLVPELAHSCRHVRQVAQSGLSILADICDAQPYQLVAPVKQRLFYVFTKPVRALPISIQIGYIDAVTYLMQLKHGILEPSEEINRFLRETTTISDSDLESVSNRPLDQRHLENMTKLKVSCLRLLQSSLNYPEANQSPTGKSQPKMISIFFKALYSRHSEVHQAAHDALKEIYERDPKVPKDVLTNGLRPILVSLQDPSKLKLDSLQCLSRLLQILKNYFKVEIGGRLLDSSPAIANDDVLEKASFKLIWQHDSIQLVTALIDIFHRLPVPGSHIFMDRLIDKVLYLEQRLRRTQFSPFREPLIRYLDRYPAMTLERIGASLRTNRSKACFFAQILGHEVSQPLREAIVQNPAILTECFPTDAPENEQILSTTNVIHITDTLCAYPEVGKTLLDKTTFRHVLIERGKMLWSLLQKNEVDASIRLAAEQMCDRLMSIIVFYLSHNVQDIDCIFDTIEAVTSHTLKDSARLQRFFYDHIISPGDVSRWRQVIERSIDVFVSQEHGESMKAYVLRNLLSPILAQDIMKNWDMLSVPGKGTELVDRSFVDMFTNRIWSPEASMNFSDEKAPVNIDHSRIELLQVTALLLKYYSNIVKVKYANLSFDSLGSTSSLKTP